MKTKPVASAISLSLLLSPACALAQASQDPLEVITVVSSKTAVPYRELATSVTVLNAEDLADFGQLGLSDILRNTTGVGVSNSGGLGKNTTLRVRGEEGYRTKLYIDGVELSDPSSPQVSPIFDDLLATQIERVEILRGPQGLAYGADAGGVISVFTKQAEDGLQGSVSAEFGRYDSQLFTADVAVGNQQGGAFLAVTDFNTEGFNAQEADASGESDGYDNRTLHFSGRYHLSKQLTGQLVVRDVDAQNQYDACFDNSTFAPTNDCKTDTQNSTARLSLAYQDDNQSHQVGLAQTDLERRFINNGEFGFANEGRTQLLDYAGEYRFDHLRVVWGADIEKEENQATGEQRYQRGVFAELQGEVTTDTYLNLAARHDNNDTFGSHTSYRLGAAKMFALSTNQQIKFKAAFGTGFRAPSLFEQGYNDGPFAFGAAAGLALKEETSQGFDLGLEYFAKNLRTELVWFSQEVEDEIVFDPITFQGYLQVEGTSESQGIEASLEHDVNQHLTLWANHTYNDTETSTGEARLRRPKNLTNLGLRANAWQDKLSFSLSFRSIHDAVDIAGVALENYTVMNVAGRYQYSENLLFTARIDNALDNRYQEVAGFNTADRSYSVGIQAQF